MNTTEYLKVLSQRFKNGISREHSYRADLEQLIRNLVPDVEVTNEPANVTDCGNPDYVISKKNIPIGYIEAKDIGKDLNSKSYKEQFTRYKNALDNLIITDYVWFQFFQNGDLVYEIRIADIEEGQLKPLEANYKAFENHIRDFCTFIGQTIKSSQKLAKMMAGKARLFQDVLEKATTSDEENEANNSLQEQYKAFQQILIHDITPKAFADLYAQTLAYGMFAARLQDQTLEDFSRQEAAELIPKSNPFLRKLFQYIAGYDIDERIKVPVDNLADVFRATNIRELLKDFGKSTQQNDPIIHFYETFLSEYDPKLRKSRGVWYTPEPVVKFIVRAVDDILKTEFDLKDGLADTSKTKITVNTDVVDKRSKTGYKQVEKEVHKVQILDPATGTGTFLAEVIKFIYNGKFKAMQGVWSSYVENDLIPRLNGFELLMASYAMAHLKLDLLLQETGFKAKKEQRFRVYLTNSLEEHHKDTGTLFANWLSSEANEANYIKRDTPVMCVIGNPPYSAESANKGKWIKNLMEVYKKEPGGKEKLRERNPKAINDDYVKFLRYGQHFIEKNRSGVLAFINPHGFLDNPTFRGMRWCLLSTYDKIYTIDLHGNSKKKEVAPDGSSDFNVFDIQQGVSINLFVKTGKKKAKELGQVFQFDIFGKRKFKYDFLNKNSLSTIQFNKLSNVAPMYFMIPKDYQTKEEFNKGFDISDLFKIYGMGIATGNDSEYIAFERKELQARFEDENYIQTIDYRLFDKRFIYNDYNLIERGREQLMSNMLNKSNIGLISLKRARKNFTNKFGLVNCIADKSVISTLDNGYLFPLYLCQKNNGQESIERPEKRVPNLNLEIVQEIAELIELSFTNEKELKEYTFAPIDILDYIYAVIHSPIYREKYKEFLKIDFPKVPYPKDQQKFWELVALGKQIREIHLLESEKTEQYITSYPKDGNNVVSRKMTKTSIGYEAISETHGRVWINDEQYFDKVPLIAWEFYIGGYQPAQKWLKDRKERELSFEDILHYQKIIVALTETDRLMKEIDEVGVE